MIAKTAEFIQRSLSFYTGQVFGVHFLILCALLFLGYQRAQSIDQTKKFNLKLVESSIRVDMVAMPRLTVKELKSITPDELELIGKKEAPPKVVKKEEVSQNPSKIDYKKKKKKLNFMEMLKLQAKKKLPKAKVAKKRKTKKSNSGEGGISSKERNRLRKLLLAGNKISAGNAAVGEGNSGDPTENSEYLLALREQVKSFWKLPSFLIEQELSCHIRIFLKSDGSLIKTNIFQSSGNSEYDRKALSAVKSAAPFPTLPIGLRESGLKGQISLGFPL